MKGGVAQFAGFDEFVFSGAFADGVQIPNLPIDIDPQTLCQLLTMNYPKLDIQIRVRILGLKPPQILHLQILLLVQPPRHVAHKVIVLLFQCDQQLMLIMQFSNPLVVREHLLHEFVFGQELEVLLVPEPDIPESVCQEEHVLVEELIDDINPLALRSVFEKVFEGGLELVKVDEVEVRLD